MRTLKIIISFILIGSAHSAFAFLRDADQLAVINKLNDLQLQGFFDENHIVSFDSIRCQKSSRSCLLHLRIVDPESDFGSIRHGVCLIDEINSVYDIFEEESKKSSQPFAPLTKSFFKAVRNCHGVLESDDELMD
jgi:hypothetical protein